MDSFAETEHFGLELEVQCDTCQFVFEPCRKDILIEGPVPGGVTFSCCCPGCGDEVLFDRVCEPVEW